MKPRRLPFFARRKHRARAARTDGGEVRIGISPVLLIMAAVFVAFGMAYEFCCSITAVVLHECAHARVAKKYGYALDEIKLMPYGAALCGDVDMRVKHEIVIAAVGPLFNLFIGLIFAALWWLVPSSYLFTETFCVCNIYIGVFNLLPVYPLDGGRIFLALLSRKLKRKKAYTVVRIVSAVFGAASIALFIASAFYTPNACFLSVGLFMVASALIPDERARYRSLFSLGSVEKRLSRPTETRTFAVSGDTALGELCRMLDPDKFTEFEVYDGEARRIAEFDELRLIERIKTEGYGARADGIHV